MSRCISSHGEYSAHELDENNRCDWCRVWQCPKCGMDEPYPLDGDDHECVYVGLESVPVPRWLRNDLDALAGYYRKGITDAIWMRERRVLPSYRAYVIGSTSGLRFADRVRMVWLRRHPISRDLP